MAIYSTLTPVEQKLHGIWESSKLRATLVGPVYDALVRDGEGKNAKPIDVDNGVAIKIGDFSGNGLQERYATIAGVGDMIAVTGAPAIIKDSFTKAQASIVNFYNPAGEPVKAYGLYDDHGETDIFGVGRHQFTEASVAAAIVGNYVVVSGDGAWVAQAAAPDADTYGFIGKIHSIARDNIDNVTIVRIAVIQNKQVA